MKYSITFDIQSYDTDFGDGINNVTYVRWLDTLRTGWFDNLISRPRQQADALVLAVSRVEVDYLSTVGFYDGNSKIVGTVEDIQHGFSRVVFQASFYSGPKQVATAVQKTLLASLKTRRPVKFPKDVLEKLGSVQAEIGK